MSDSSGYGAEHIKILTGVEHVRARPAMYIGGVDDYGLHRMLSGVLDNSLGRAALGRPSRVAITLEDLGWINIDDDGQGLPAEPESQGPSLLEFAFTKLGQRPGLRGDFRREPLLQDYALVSALSESLTVDSRCQGEAHRLRVERGQRVGAIEYRGPCARQGLNLRFRPDPKIFGPSVNIVRRRLLTELRELAALLPSLTIELIDRRYGLRRVDRFRCRNGLSDLVSAASEAPLLSAPLRRGGFEPAAGEGRIELDLALQLQASPGRTLIGFVNGARIDRGEHEEAALLGLRVGLRELAEVLALPEPERLGARLALSLKHPGPSYNAGRDALLSSDVNGPIANLVAAALNDWGEAAPGEARRVLSAP